jgi:Xaa-Pro aminopeptidase
MKRIVVLLLSLAATSAFAIDAAEFATRRARLAKEIGPNAMLVVFSAKTAIRNGDVEYPFRQSDDLLYLTGIEQTETTLVMLPGESDFKEVIFTRERNPTQELFTGKVLSNDEVTKISGIKQVFGAGRARMFINSVALGGGQWPWPNPDSVERMPKRALPAFIEAVRGARAEVWLALVTRNAESEELQFAEELRKRYPEVVFRDAHQRIRAMREVKSAAEIATLQRAVDISVAAHKAAMKRALTAANEAQVEATADFVVREATCCWGYPPIVASGANATTLHYDVNNAPVDRKGLFLMDMGAEVDGYSCDVTRTFPAGGKFSPDQRAVYDAVLAAQNAAIAAMKPGARLGDADNAAIAVLGRELVKLGLTTKDDPRQVFMYFRHGIGHHIGLDVHDVWDRDRVAEPGMTFAIEPGVYVRKDDVLAMPTFTKLPKEEQEKIRAALDRFNGMGVRIEDDVVVTSGAPVIMSAAAPRTAAEVEAWLASK